MRRKEMEDYNNLVGRVAYNLNNILSGILDYPEILLKNMDKKSEEAQMIMSIYESGVSCSQIVDSLISLRHNVSNDRELYSMNQEYS